MKMLQKYSICLLLSMAMTLPATSQIVEKYSVNRSIDYSTIPQFVLPSEADEMMYADGRLHFSAGGKLFASTLTDGVPGFPEVDTVLLETDSRMTYAVSHDGTGRLYLNRHDSKGNSYLFEYYEKKPGKYGVRRVKPSGFTFTIEHPVFSADGRVMVFASNCPLGFGGRDLWYSEWKDGQWQYPENLGGRINSAGDEASPVIYGDFLLFSSNGRAGGYGGYDIYATRLVAKEQTGDTVGMFPIGRCPVYSMNAPMCSSGDDIGLTISPDGTMGWWFSRDAEGKQVLNRFSGRLDCVQLQGTVRGQDGSPLADAKVKVVDKDDRTYTVDVDKKGEYVVYLQPGKHYDLQFYAPDHFQYHLPYVAERGNENNLYYRDMDDVTLNAFVVGQIYRYADLFSSSVGSELSAAGRKRMDAVARFIIENPNLKIAIESSFNQSADIPFCTLVNQSRIRAISDYLSSKGVPLSNIETGNGAPEGQEDIEDSAMLSAVAVSSLTMSFVFVR